MTDALPCHIHLPVCLWIMDPHSRAPKKNTSHGNKVLPQDTTHPCKDHVTDEEVPAKIQRAIRRHEDLLKIVKRRKLQWHGHISRSSGLAKTILRGTVKGGRRHADRGRGGKTTSGNGQAWSTACPRGQWRTGKKWKKTGCKIICVAPTTLAVNGLMIMMMMMILLGLFKLNQLTHIQRWIVCFNRANNWDPKVPPMKTWYRYRLYHVGVRLAQASA